MAEEIQKPEALSTDKIPVIKIPPSIEKRLKRGRERMWIKAGERNMFMEFARGNQYLWRGKSGQVYEQSTVTNPDGSGKPRHKVRQTRNLIKPLLDAKVSGATQRIPSYEIDPSTSDHEDIGAARIAERVALAGYDIWNIRRITQKAVYYALVADESFTMAYYDTSIGPYITDPESGDTIGVGDVRLKVFSPNEVYWEPGVDFDDSRWYAIEHARPIDQLKKEEGYIGGDLKPDAEAQRVYNRSDKIPQNAQNLVMVTEYFERPCADYPEGRRIVMANKKQVFMEEPYPLRNGNGEIIDAPCMHRLAYSTDPDSDRDQGLVRHLIDAQRTYNNANNKALEWVNLTLAPQMLAPEGSITTEITDEPGAIFYYRALPGEQVPQWRPTPNIPREIFEVMDRAKQDMGFIASSNDIPSGVDSGKGISALIERDQLAWQHFIVALAEWHSRIMRDCLTLVQRYYTEPRIMKFRGRAGWESIEDFQGTDLRGQTDVRVLPGSIEPRTRASIEQKVMNYAQLGWISPQAAMSAIDGGTAEKLVESYELDVARAHQIIKKIKQGADVLFMTPPHPDGTPGWMPRPFDNIDVHKSVFEDWMKTSDWDNLPDPMKESANLYYLALNDLEAAKAARDQMLASQAASDQGMLNAAKPQGPPVQGSLPAMPDPGQ